MIPDLIAILSISFVLGVRHATDTDHIVAVSTIISRQKKGIPGAALIGVFWSLGHSLTVTLVGLPIIAYSFVIPKQAGIFLELAVGLMLVALGIQNFTNPIKLHKHAHAHGGDTKHLHTHTHLPGLPKGNFHHLEFSQIIRPIFVGLIHGLAGSAAIALLVLSSIHDKKLASLYLLIFHSGVLLGMLVVTVLIGIFIEFISNRSEAANRYLVSTSGILSIILGLLVVYRLSV